MAACVLLFLTLLPIAGQAQDGLQLGPESPLGARIPSAAPGYQFRPAIARGTDSSIAVWVQRPKEPGDATIVARRLDDRGVPLDDAATEVGRPVSDAAPGVDFGAGVYLVGFADAAGAVVATRLRADGRVHDGDPVKVTTGGHVTEVQVVWRGDAFAVVWVEENDSRRPSQHAVLVSADGELLTPSPVLLVDDASGSALAGPPGELLVLWSDHSGTDSGEDVFGRRFGASLRQIGDTFAVTAPGRQEQPDAIFDGDAYTVAWADYRAYPETQIRVASMTVEGAVSQSQIAGTHEYFNDDVDVTATAGSDTVVWKEVGGDTIYARRLSSDGTFAEAAPVVVYSTTAPWGAGPYEPAPTPEGTVVVLGGFDGDLRENIFSVRLPHADGGASAPVLVSRSANGQRSPAVAGNGRAALVVWQDWRATAWEEHFNSGIPEWPIDLYAARLTESGLVPEEGVRLSGGRKAEAHPDVAWNGRVFVAGWTDYASTEVRLRTVGLDGTLGPVRSVTGRGSYNAVPRIAGGGGRGYVVWFNETGGFPADPAVAGAPLDRAGRPGRTRILFDGDTSGWDVVAGGRGFTAGWLAGGRIYTRSFSRRGAPVSRRRVVAPASEASDLRLGAGDGRILATWQAPNDDRTAWAVFATVLDARGQRVTAVREIGTAGLSPAEVLWDGGGFLVAWHKMTGEDAQALEAVKVDPSGRVTGRDTRPLGTIFRSYTQLGVTLHSTGPLVVYERHAPEPIYGGVSRIFSRPLR